MVKPSPAAVNARCHPLLQQQAIIWLIFGLLALISHISGLDTSLAQALYNPASSFAWFVRQTSNLPTALLAIASLVIILFPALARNRSLLYKAAAVFLFTTVIGAGLLNQVVVKELANRPRPRDVLLSTQAPTAQPRAEIEGNSMPSGHAGLAYVLAAPFFVLRREKPKTAKTFLATGLTLGTLVGLARMVLGAHFLSDVLIAGAITLATASLGQSLFTRFPKIPRKAIVILAILATSALVLGNHFNVTLTRPLAEPFRRINLPCPVETYAAPETQTPTLIVQLSGYGSPVSTLNLVEDEGVISLQTHLGLYHHLACTAKLAQPIGPYE